MKTGNTNTKDGLLTKKCIAFLYGKKIGLQETQDEKHIFSHTTTPLQ